MAKLTGALRIKGKLKSADAVFVERGSGIYMRSLPKVKTEKSEAFKEQTKGAGSVARLAGQVNRLFKKLAPGDTRPRMYVLLLKQFRKAPSDQRLLRLFGLSGLDAHRTKTIRNAGLGSTIQIIKEARRLKVFLDHSYHAVLQGNQLFYRLEIIVAEWTAKEEDPTIKEQHTKWIYPIDKLRKYEFSFDLRDDCAEYLVMLRCRLAERPELNAFPPDNLVKVFEAGSFDEAAIAELHKQLAARKEIKTIARDEWEDEDDGVEGEEK